MKKLLTILITIFFSFSLLAQERELSDYEKYRMELENEKLNQVDEEIEGTIKDVLRILIPKAAKKIAI